MRVVVALGGNALLKRGEKMSAENQIANMKKAAKSLAALAEKHQIIITHGNGPQVGLLALQASSYSEVDPYPLDVLGAESVGQIGYLLEQQMKNVLPPDQQVATLLTQIEVDPKDPAFDDPTKFIGPVFTKEEVDRLAITKGFTFKRDGEHYRRVVASPRPHRILAEKVIRFLVENNTVVICAGGGGLPTAYGADGALYGVEAVIDKDRSAELLARQIDADALLLLTDVDSVYLDWGTPRQKLIRKVSPNQFAEFDFPDGSMGPKVEAASNFARATGNIACIGKLDQALEMLEGTAGTTVSSRVTKTVLLGPDGAETSAAQSAEAEQNA
ncbi:carbamate kinase [Palleronia sediminis]|uniref:Carbamate kinase n=1 Tax=Palleronia sediminis TaxID=2547833 RepID=A0A4R6A6F8_9RHOB|nr:carbamate kinase [Palleronia sediminis]TDL78304.1 carbamate kinase [Palleronia sediminis]